MSAVERADDELFTDVAPKGVRRFLARVGLGNASPFRRALAVALVGWVPLAVLSQFGFADPTTGSAAFMADFAAHARSLLAAPLLVAVEGACGRRLGRIGCHFLAAGFVPEEQRPRFEQAVAATLWLREAPLAAFVSLFLCYAPALAVQHLPIELLPGWHLAAGGRLPVFSLAGWWNVLVSIPLLLALMLSWLWRLLLWAYFVQRIARIELRLVAAHPDRAAGLKFVGYAVRVFAPLGLAFGLIGAGSIANAVVHRGESLAVHRVAILGLTVFVVLLVSAPLLAFAGQMLHAWQRGVFAYGGLASALGRELEARWFARPRIDDSALGVQDFSATTDLFQTVANVYEMKLLPVDVRSLVLVAGATLLPFVPVVFMGIPTEVVLEKIASLFI